MEALALVRVKLTILKNSYLKGNRRQLILKIFFALFILAFGAMLFKGMVAIMSVLDQTTAQALLVAALSAMMTFCVFWGLGPILNELYLRSDLELLLVAPVSRRAIFLSKFLEALNAVILPGILALATMWSYGFAQHCPWSYFVVSLVALVLTVSIAALLCIIFVMLVMRYLPTRRAQEIWTVLWTLCFGLLWAGWMIFSRSSTNRTQVALGAANLAMRRGQFLNWAPAGWAAQLCLALNRGDIASALARAALLIGVAGLLYLLAQWIFDRAFYEGWSKAQESPSRPARKARKPR